MIKTKMAFFPANQSFLKTFQFVLIGWIKAGPPKNRTENRKKEKRPKNSTFKPLSTIFVPCLKIQEATASLPPAADAHGTVRSLPKCNALQCQYRHIDVECDV